MCTASIKKFLGLKSKMYTFTIEDNHECKKAEGIDKNILDDKLKYEDYTNVLFSRWYIRHEMNRIQSNNHNNRGIN